MGGFSFFNQNTKKINARELSRLAAFVILESARMSG
jgi:hypothetical protein